VILPLDFNPAWGFGGSRVLSPAIVAALKQAA
jgi:hypothetical protein